MSTKTKGFQPIRLLNEDDLTAAAHETVARECGPPQPTARGQMGKLVTRADLVAQIRALLPPRPPETADSPTPSRVFCEAFLRGATAADALKRVTEHFCWVTEEEYDDFVGWAVEWARQQRGSDGRGSSTPAGRA